MIIEIDRISKAIKNNIILNDVSCAMESGKVYGIYGHNGCGKTMLMRCMLGLVHVDSGNIFIDRKVIGKDIDFPDSVGAIIENPKFFNSASGFENLKLLASIKKIADNSMINFCLDKVGLDAVKNQKVRKYSLGMRQRLAIAQAIMERPKLIILDEPSNALDENGVEMLRNVIREEATRGALIIFSSHDKEDIAEMADVQIKMSSGRIVEMSCAT